MAVSWLVPVLLLVVPSYGPVLGGKVDMTGFNALLRVSNSVPFFTVKMGLRTVP
jgi:hypothetical protein